MNQDLPDILGSLDKRFLAYLDADGEMLLGTVRRLRLYTVALLDGSITPPAVVEDWSDFYHLLPAFVAEYAPLWVADLEGAAELLDGPGGHALLAAGDVAYLLAVEPVLDRYPDIRTDPRL